MSADFKSYSAELMTRVKAGNEQALIELGVGISTEAKNLAPVDFGQLRNSIQWQTSKSAGGYVKGHSAIGKPGKTKKGTEYVRNFSGGEDGYRIIEKFNPKSNELFVGATAEHAIHQEFGTRYQRPQPFMRPAINKFTRGSNVKNVIGGIMRTRSEEHTSELQSRYP